MRTFSCDIETDGIDATKVWCIAVHNIDTDQVITFAGSCLNLFKPWLESEADCLIFHNGISFDVRILRRLLGVNIKINQMRDTLVMSQLFNPVRDKGHSLQSWGEILHYPKMECEDFSTYTDDMLEYCKNDVNLTETLYKQLFCCQ